MSDLTLFFVKISFGRYLPVEHAMNFPAQHLVFCLCFQLAGSTSADPVVTAPAPSIVHIQEALRATLASGKPTPLNALTPYGKREVIRKIRWNENGLAGFGSTPLVRQLGHGQLAAVLSFLGAASICPYWTRSWSARHCACRRCPARLSRIFNAFVNLRR